MKIFLINVIITNPAFFKILHHSSATFWTSLLIDEPNVNKQSSPLSMTIDIARKFCSMIHRTCGFHSISSYFLFLQASPNYSSDSGSSSLPRSPIPEYDETNKANKFDKGSLPKVKDSFNLDDEARVKLDLQESEKSSRRVDQTEIVAESKEADRYNLDDSIDGRVFYRFQNIANWPQSSS